MNWMEVLISAGIAVILGFITTRLRNSNKLGKIGAILWVIIPIVVGNIIYYQYINPNKFSGNDRAQIEQSLESFPVFQTLKKQEPALYTQLIDNFLKSKKEGQSEQQLIDEMKQSVAELTMQRIQHAPDKNVIDYMNIILDELRYYQANNRSEHLCFKALFPQVSGGVNATKVLPKELLMRDLDSVNSLFTSSTGGLIKPENQEYENKLNAIVGKMQQQYGHDLQMFVNPAAPEVDREKICDMAIDMYSQILKLPANDAGAILRSMLGGE
ncbi:DNA gyrase [Yersinia hibernica]|uniref:DNA gyrase n=1 Tax=Yersinia hibernica TaxID=2339259 RepID=A0ABX5R3X1_9GAMM|nr:DNA gyrase [Yersinia hibernica]QAX80068.1 DNA gyrase [Yersinia hibernica]